jgi:hypothetical protein
LQGSVIRTDWCFADRRSKSPFIVVRRTTMKGRCDGTQASSDRTGTRRVDRRRSTQRAELMKRIGMLAFYAVGALAMLYLALYAYAAFTGRELQPGDPIHIFRKPDAPSYS